MAILNFPVQSSPYEGLADSLISGYNTGTKAKEEHLSFPEQLRQLQANTKLLDTRAKYAEPMAQADLTQQQVLAKYADPLAQANLTQQQVRADYARPNARVDLQQQELANALAGIQNKYADKNAQAALLGSQLGNQEKQINLKYLPQENEAKIASDKALANYRQMGGGRGGVKYTNQVQLMNSIKKDNPNLSDDQAFEAAGNLIEGNPTLSNGQPFKVGGLTRNMADVVAMGGVPAPITTGNVRANQAEQEIGVLNEYAQKGLAPYGDTFLNMNPQQISDTFKTDDASQDRLGKFIAAQAIQYEIAQNRIRLAAGQPGIGSTEELMKLSQQSIGAKYPKLSYKARKESSRYLDEALKEGLKARNRSSHPSLIGSNSPPAKINNDPWGIR